MKTFLFLAMLLPGAYDLVAQSVILDSLYRELQKNPEGDSNRVSILVSACYREYTSNPERNKAHAEEALEISRRIRYTTGILQATRYIALYYWSAGEYEIAMEYACELLRIAEAANLVMGIGNGHQLIGLISEAEGDFKDAGTHYSKALTVYRKADAKNNVALAYNSLGSMNFNLQELDTALNYFSKAMDLCKHIDDEDGLSQSYANIAEVYSNQGRYRDALEHFFKAQSILEKTGDKYRMATIYEGLASTYMRLGEVTTAEQFLERAIVIAKELRNRKVLQSCYERLAGIEKSKAAFEAALTHFMLASAYKDSILSEAKSSRIAEIHAQYENVRKDKLIQVLERDKRIRILWTRWLIGALVVVVIASVTMYVFKEQNERKNKHILSMEIDQLTTQTRELTEKFRNILTLGDKNLIDSQDQQLLKKAIEVVEHNISEPGFSVDWMAKDIGMSRSNLHRRIKSITGFPPNELIRSIRLRKAAILLLKNTNSISQISIAVGFDDHSYFSRAFRKQFGVSPSEYQEKAG